MEKVAEICAQAIKDRVFSGCVVGCALPDGSFWTNAYGADDYEGGVKLTEHSIFDIASVTKSVPVATLALKGILEGILDLHDPVCSQIPELSNACREQIQLWHLLTHSLDFRFPMSTLKDLPAAEILQRIFSHPFAEPPGTLFNYGNAASILLGLFLQRKFKASLPELAQNAFFSPMGMVDSGWFPLQRLDVARIVPTEQCSWRGKTMRGEVHDESAYTLQNLGAAGAAGMFSTVPDLLRFARMMLADGVHDNQRILPAGVLHLVTQNALPHLAGQSAAFGWELANRKFMGSVASPHSFGKTGFTGASMVCDPSRNAAVVLLSNFTWPKREPNVERIYEIRRRVHDALFAAIPVTES